MSKHAEFEIISALMLIAIALDMVCWGSVGEKLTDSIFPSLLNMMLLCLNDLQANCLIRPQNKRTQY